MARWFKGALGGGLLAFAATATYLSAMATEPPAATPVPKGLVSYTELLARPHAPADARIAYGPAPQEFGDLWLPKTKGRHPVVVLIHGGCWLASLPSTELMDQMAGDLRDRGYAVWNLAYRRIGEAGGGYPGTFADVATGLDKLRDLARTHPLDLSHVAVMGHSAGGHLAAWIAVRDHLPAASPLRTAHPLPVKGVVSLAGIPDLEFARAEGLVPCDGPPTIDALTGLAQRKGQDVYADTSPVRMLPNRVPMVMLSGALDPIVPPPYTHDFLDKARTHHAAVSGKVLPGAGHFEVIDPRSAAWSEVLAALTSVLK